MKLEDLKQQWQSMEDTSPELPSQKIRQMIRLDYRRRLRRVLWPEVLLALVYAYFVVLLIGFFDLLDTAFLTGLGVTTILLLLLLPSIRFYLLRRLFVLSDPGQSYAAALRSFARYKLRFLRLRRAQAGIGFVLLVAVSVLATRVYGEYDVTESKYFWALLFSGGFIGVQVINYWLLRHYRAAISAAEDLLQELKN